jgi:hypothetical protein
MSLDLNEKITLMVVRDFLYEKIIINETLKTLFIQKKIRSLKDIENINQIAVHKELLAMLRPQKPLINREATNLSCRNPEIERKIFSKIII